MVAIFRKHDNSLTMKKKIEIPDNVFKILKDHKKLTGRSITSMIQESLYRWLIHERLMIIQTETIFV